MLPNIRTPDDLTESATGFFAERGRDSLVGYERGELDRRIRDAFRERQQQNKDRHVQYLVLGKGLGTAAEDTLREGYYNPRKVLEPIPKSEQQRHWTTIDLRNMTRTALADALTSGAAAESEEAVVGAGEATDGAHETSSLCSVFSKNAAATSQSSSDNPAFPLMEKLCCTYHPVKGITEARMEVAENIKIAEAELNALCTPFLFSEVLETLSMALLALEHGVMGERVSLPMHLREPPSDDPVERQAQLARESDDPLFLTGPDEVLHFIREHVFPVAFGVLPVTHTAQWMAHYTVTFLRSITTQTQADAEIRVQLLSHCVRILGDTENFSSVLLSLQSKAEEYDVFNTLRESAEEHIGTLLGDVERTLTAVLTCTFPTRRARLELVERGVRTKLQRALLFLNEIDYNWTPNVRFHAEWKLHFLSDAFRRLHVVISPAYAKSILGFIDSALYTLVTDSRVSGRLLGSLHAQPQVPLARQVEYERTIEGFTFPQIGMAVNGTASLIVGHQLCMGSRYVLRECTPAYDKKWGFPMDEHMDIPTAEEVNETISKLTSRVRSKMAKGASDRPPRSTVFLTQGGEGEEDEDEP